MKHDRLSIKAVILGLISLLLLPCSLNAQSLAAGTVVYPVMGSRLSSKFGLRRHPIKRVTRHHSGVDLAVPSNSHVRAIKDGVVAYAGVHGAYGKLVSIQHKGGYISLYGHLNEIGVVVGQSVAAGTVIGRVGSTGRTTGPHLHFEWRLNGKAIDPLKVFPSLTEKAEG